MSKLNQKLIATADASASPAVARATAFFVVVCFHTIPAIYSCPEVEPT